MQRLIQRWAQRVRTPRAGRKHFSSPNQLICAGEMFFGKASFPGLRVGSYTRCLIYRMPQEGTHQTPLPYQGSESPR